MKYFIFLFSMLWIAAAEAATFTCEELKSSINFGSFEKIEFYTRQSDVNFVKTNLLKSALVVSKSMTEEELADVPDKKLYKDYDPIFRVIRLQNGEFQTVNLSFGDNPFVYLYDMDTLNYSGVTSQDGSVYIDDNHCDVEADILN